MTDVLSLLFKNSSVAFIATIFIVYLRRLHSKYEYPGGNSVLKNIFGIDNIFLEKEGKKL